MNKSPTQGDHFDELFSARVQELSDWRGKLLTRVRALIKQADPEVVEDWKWNIPVWKHDGMICTGETYKTHVKLTFAKGASLQDPAHLFTQPGTVRSAIDFEEGDALNEQAVKALVKAAVALNQSSGRPAAKRSAKPKTRRTRPQRCHPSPPMTRSVQSLLRERAC